MRLAVLFALSILILNGFENRAAAQGVEFWNQQCKKLLKDYAKKPRHKAFAVSNSNSGGGGAQACGMAWSAGSKKQAEAEALKVCRSQRAGSCWVNRSE